jgi:hypothetical protein
MVRRKSYKLERQPPGYTYGEAEIALAAALGIDAKHRGLLRARLKNLQRLGLPGTAPGKGARARYTRTQLGQWLLAMLIADVGIDPTIVVQAVKAQWKGLEPWTIQAADWEAARGDSVWVALRPGLAASAWRRENAGLLISMFRSSPRSDNLAQMASSARDAWICLLDFTRPSIHLENALPQRS